MIDFHYETDFKLDSKQYFTDWINRIINSEDYILEQLDYIFCDDSYLLNINQQYLDHDTYTDIITFDYTDGKIISGDIFISIQRVKDNAESFSVAFLEELKRVMAHGVLHLCGYKDKTDADVKIMRQKENEKIELFHVEQ